MVYVSYVEAGSPPRVWGVRVGPDEHYWNRRFTPTNVGSTRLSKPRHLSTAVHPHFCEEYVNCKCPGPAFHGSPPRVWGVHRH